MASTKPPSRVVFIGNIPYGLSEEQIQDIFNGAGRVLNFRLVYDRETGRPKGFGFAEYPDADSAASAVRNLNDYEIMGRKLRVDFSNDTGGDDDRGDGGGGGRDHHAQNGSSNHHQASYQSSIPSSNQAAQLPPLPPGKELPPGVTCTDAISRTLNTLPPAQLLDVLQQMKTLATADPARATTLLTEAPQLAYAIFQALLLLGLVSPEAITSVIDPAGIAAAAAAPAPVAAPPPSLPYGYPGATNTPPIAAPVGGYAAPPQPVAAAPAAAGGGLLAGAGELDPAALMRAVMELPQAMIDQLPEGERQQILALRASYAGQGR